VGKIDELSSVASELGPDIILVTETWCNNQVSDAFLSLPNYELVTDLRKDRFNTDRGRGGGLLVYTKKDLPVFVLSDENDDVEHQYCKFKVNDITVYLIYRSPSGGPGSISGLADMVKAADKKCIFFGDFNLPEIDWAAGTARGRSRELLEAAHDRLMEQLVPFSTHVRGNTLDLVLTDIPERVVEVTEEGRLGASDHVILMTTVTIKAGSAPQERGMPDWRRADWPAMNRSLASENWEAHLSGRTAAQAWELFKTKVQKLVTDHVPERRRRNHNKPPWLNREILRAIRKKKRLWREAKQGQRVAEYKACEKEVRNKIRNAKRKFEREIAKGCGSEQASKKRFFSYIKRKTKSRPGIGPLKDGSGRVVQEDGEMAKLLNSFFSSVFTREDTTNVPEPEDTGCRDELRSIKITARAVKEKINKLRVDSAAGPDGIGPLLLKKLADTVAAPLAKIMQASLNDGTVPDDWRNANVTPIFKKGRKSDPGNYRPVSLTSVSCRLMESIMKDQIVKHLEKNNLIRSSQHGFMKGRSCTSNLLVFL
jgi:hypothetical protein